MAKPRLIILIRHAQSEGNKNRDIHQTVPDHRVKLTPEGWNQAYDAGRRLRKLLRPDDKIHFFTSPYRRTRDTTEGILATLTSDSDEPSPFRRSAIKVYEEPRLREQDFGNFQPCSAEMERMWQERSDYGHFFYRIPNGESAADAYDRVSGFNESLWRQFSEDDFASVCILVTHGLMSRVFLMKWYHFDVEYFEDLRNVEHCEFLIMRKQDNGKYNLETKLRTWSQLKSERAAVLKGHENDKGGKDRIKDYATRDDVKLQRCKTFISTRRWGGCPDGCSHTNKYSQKYELELRKTEPEQATVVAVTATDEKPCGSLSTHHRHRVRRAASTDEGEDDQGSESLFNKNSRSACNSSPFELNKSVTQNTHSASTNLPSDATAEPLGVKRPQSLHLGRDFGGSYSGHTSIIGSDSDKAEEQIDGHYADDDDSSLANSDNHIDRDGHQIRGRRSSGDDSISSIDIRLLQSTISNDQGEQVSDNKATLAGIGSFINRLGDAPPRATNPRSNPRCSRRRGSDGLPAAAVAGAIAPRLDHSDNYGRQEMQEDGSKLENLAAAEAMDRSIQGSVY